MDKKLLEEIGLTRSEISIYLGLLKIGEVTTGAILKEAKVSGGKVYQILDKLIDKGLVSFIARNNIRYFSAAPPKRILDYFNRRENEFVKSRRKLESEILSLEKIQQNSKEEVLMFSGFKSFETAIFRALEDFEGKEILSMGVRLGKSEKFNLLWEKWHNVREKKRINCRVLLSEGDKKFFKKFKRCNVRILEGITPSAVAILGDVVLIQSYGDVPSCVYIKSSDTANSFVSFFESLWK